MQASIVNVQATKEFNTTGKGKKRLRRQWQQLSLITLQALYTRHAAGAGNTHTQPTSWFAAGFCPSSPFKTFQT